MKIIALNCALHYVKYTCAIVHGQRIYYKCATHVCGCNLHKLLLVAMIVQYCNPKCHQAVEFDLTSFKSQYLEKKAAHWLDEEVWPAQLPQAPAPADAVHLQ